jgi:hypothetical protein
MMKRYSNSYIFTADPLSCDSMQQINVVKRTVDILNSQSHWVSDSYGNFFKKYWRIKLQGRLGKNNPAAPKYRRRRGPVSIALADATRYDVYVYCEHRLRRANFSI